MGTKSKRDERHPVIDPVFDVVEKGLEVGIVVAAVAVTAFRRGATRFVDTLARAGEKLEQKLEELGDTPHADLGPCPGTETGQHVVAQDDPVCAACGVDTKDPAKPVERAAHVEPVGGWSV